MDRERKARPSLAHLAAKYNTAPPPGYVPGRGRGASGFTKPPPELPKRGKGRRGADGAAASSNGAEADDGARYGDAEGEAEDAVGGADYEPDEVDDSAAAFQAGGFDDEGKLRGEAGDTRNLDLGGTEKFEMARTTMTQMEAGYEIEPFNMKQERMEGHFDDDFNYVWKPRGDEADEAHDAWLGEVDESKEADDKVAKRRRLVAAQMAKIGKQEEEAADVPALAGRVVGLLEPGESVAAALRRLSELGRLHRKQRAGERKAQGAAAGGGSDVPAAGAVAGEKSDFDVLTEAADRLLRAGQFEVYSETRETLARMAGAGAGHGDSGAGAGEGAAPTTDGVTQEAHDAALAGGFVLDAASGCYHSSSSGLWFDARSGLYWPAGGGDTYYVWNAEGQTFKPVGAAAAPVDAAAAE